MSLFLALTLLVFAAGICVLILGLIRAPIGYEDQNGFHAAMRPLKVAVVRPAPAPLAEPVRMHELSVQT